MIAKSGRTAKRPQAMATLPWMICVVFCALGCSGSSGGEEPDTSGVPDVHLDPGQADSVQPGDDGSPVDVPMGDAPGEATWADVVSDASVSDVNDVSGEACVPKCEGVVCGDDGCGDVCGYCPYGFICKVGLCIEYCIPDCEGKECGDDGCGGWCADCADNETCSPSFTCVLKSCVPSCDVNECGPDGCGGDCGKCGEGFVCLEGKCETDTSCHDVTAEGTCDGDTLLWCEGGVLQKEVCDTAAGFVCGYSQLAKKHACVTPEQCEPQCQNKECGPDQCGGECGQCDGIEVCSSGGKCGPPCGDVTEDGACNGDVLSFCHQGILIIYDCQAANKTCTWDPTGNSGKGWNDCL